MPQIETHTAQQLSTLSTLLQTPFDGDDLNTWRSDVLAAATQLFEADKAVFNLPTNGSANFFSNELENSALEKYADALALLDRKYDVWDRMASLKVANKSMIWDEHLDDYHESQFFRKVARPHRAYGALAMTVPLNDGPARADQVASLVLHYDSKDALPFDETDRLLGRLIYPSFQSAVREQSVLTHQQSDFTDLIDSVNQGLSLFDADGTELHRNPALLDLLEADPEGQRLEARIYQVAQALIHLTGHHSEPSARTDLVQETIETRMGRYHVSGSYIGRAILSLDTGILITLERAERSLPSQQQLVNHFDLTPQQARVARLLGARKTNDEIAETLVISPHTARGHTEEVLSKLGVSSRFEVQSVLLDAFAEDRAPSYH
jgi:DNA-binding CsgD family transcriptional regulator